MTIDIFKVMAALLLIMTATRDQLVATGAGIAADLENTAKLQAPWTDRTGRARQTLTGFCMADEGTSDAINIGVAGQMEYSPFLELLHEGRFSVLLPVMEACAPDIIDRLRASLWSMEGLSFEPGV